MSASVLVDTSALLAVASPRDQYHDAALLEDPAYAWEGVTTDLIGSAVSRWLERFGDQRFSLTDAVSFELMRVRRFSVAFAYDEHFRAAGFALLS